MLFVEPEVDCLRLHLRDLRIPIAVLQQKPDAFATAPCEAAENTAPEIPSAPHSTPNTVEPAKQQPSLSDCGRMCCSGNPERGSLDAVSAESAPLSPSNRSSATVSASTRTSSASTADPQSSLAQITLDERADALHRALLSALYSRFPYELPDTLEYAYVLVVTHHAAPSISSQPLTAEELSCLATHYDFLPETLRCRTFPSHLNAVLDPAWTATAATVSRTAAAATAPPPQAQPSRPSIRVTDDTAKARQDKEKCRADEAAAAVLHNVPMAPRLYDSFFLLARELSPAQQALYYETQCRGPTVNADRQRQQPPRSSFPGKPATSPSGRRGGAAADVERFRVMNGHFIHFIPANEETASAAGTALATASQRMNRRSGGYRRVAGEGETYYISPGSHSAGKDKTASTAGTTDNNPPTDVRALHFAVYRIPLTRFRAEDQQYYTGQREELRWRQRRRYHANYRAHWKDEARRGVRSEATAAAFTGAEQRSRWPLSKKEAEASASFPERQGSSVRSPTPRRSSSSSSSSGSDSSSASCYSSSDSDGEVRKDTDADVAVSWRRRNAFDDAINQLFQHEVNAVDGTSAEPAYHTPAEQRRATRFFERCHQVLTNYALAHSSFAAEETAAPTPSHSSLEAVAPPAATRDAGSPHPCPRPALRSFPGVSYLGVTRLLYSWAPCDCYHLVMKDNNPLYYAHSSRASYQPQTVPLCLISDLALESTKSGAPTTNGHGSSSSRSPRATAAARITASSALKRATELRRSAGGATSYPQRDRDGVGEAAADAMDAGRPSPGPDISGKPLWLNQPPIQPFAAARKGGAEGDRPECLVEPTGPHPPTQSPGGGAGEEGLVRSRQPSRAPSPDRPSGLQRTSTLAASDAFRSLAPSSAVSFLRITASLVSNSISGNPRRSERSLIEKGAQVPDFLLPDAAQRGGSSSGAPAESAATKLGSRDSAETHSAGSATSSAAVANLFRALSESSLAQHKLRYGSIRSVISVAVLESSHFFSGALSDGFSMRGVEGGGTQLYGTTEATQIQESTRYCCRGLVDHTWLSLPVQCTPAEQEAIQWMPVMLGSTECVSDVGLRTAVHLGVFPQCTSDTSLNDGGSAVAPNKNGDSKDGVWPTRKGAISSLAPSVAVPRARLETAEKAKGESAGSSAPASTVLDTLPFAQPLQSRAVNSDATATTSRATPAPRPPEGQQFEAKENHKGSVFAEKLSGAVGTQLRDSDRCEVPTAIAEGRGGLRLQFGFCEAPPSGTRRAASVPQWLAEKEPGSTTPHTYYTVPSTDATSQPDTRPSSPRFSHAALGAAPSSNRLSAAISPAGTHARSLGETDDVLENAPVDLRDEEAPHAPLRSVRSARGGAAMPLAMDLVWPGESKAARTTPATVTARVSDGPTSNNFHTSSANTLWGLRSLPATGDRDDVNGIDAAAAAEGGVTQQARKAISWPDKPLPNVASSFASTSARLDPSTHHATLLPSITSSSWASLSALRGYQAQSPSPRVRNADIRREEVETIEVEEDRHCNEDADEFTPARTIEGAHVEADDGDNSSNEDEEDRYRCKVKPWQVPGVRQLPKPTTLGTLAPAHLSSPFLAQAQRPPIAPHTPPRSPRLPACFTSFNTPAPAFPSNQEPSSKGAFFGNPFSSSAHAAPSPHSPTPTPRFAVQLTPFGQPADATPPAATAARLEDGGCPSRWKQPQQQQHFSSQLPWQSTASVLSSANPSTYSALSANPRGAQKSDVAAFQSVLNCSVSAISQSSSTMDRSQSAWGRASAHQRSVQAPVAATTTALDEEECFDCAEGRPGRGAVEQRPTHGLTNSEVPRDPLKYFENIWNMRKSTHMSASPLVRSSQQTKCTNTAASPWPAVSRSQQQQQSSFFAGPFFRSATTLGAATTGVNARPAHDPAVSPFAPQKTPVRNTLGIGRLSSNSPPALSARLGTHALNSTAAAVAPTRNPRQALFIDEYDDDAVQSNTVARVTGVRSRVRPRGVSAMDATWWKPVRELSSAPNLRLSSTYAHARTMSTAAASHKPTSAGATSRSSMNLRLSTSTDQPYNVSAVDYQSEAAHPNRDGYNAPRETFARPTNSFRRHSEPCMTGRLSLYTDHECRCEPRDYLCSAEEPHEQELSRSPRQSRVPSILRRNRSPDSASATALLGRRPPNAPTPHTHCARYTSGHRYAVKTAAAATSRTLPFRAYSAAADSIEAAKRRHELMRQGKLNGYQQYLQENYMCGPVPKRFCFERPPLHPAGVTLSPREATAGIQVLRQDLDTTTAVREMPISGGPRPAFTQEKTEATAGAPQRGVSAAAPSMPAWTPRTTAAPPCLSPLATSRSDQKTAVPAFIDNPLSEASRAFSLGVHPSSWVGSHSDRHEQRHQSNDGPPLLQEHGGARSAAQQAEARLREQAAQQECMKARQQMERLADGEEAARFASGVNVSFTLRDIAAVLLRLPSTAGRGSRQPGTASPATVKSAGSGEGLEVLDICKAAWRTEGVSCFLSRKPVQLRGGWERYLERINLYQEPFYLRDQALILLLPVPHVPTLRVCVAIHNINDLLALVCQTPLPRILPTAEEQWMRHRRHGWGDDEEEQVTAPQKDMSPTVVVEERRWLFGLFTTRRILHKGGEAVRKSGTASLSERQQHRLPSPDDDDATRRARCRALRRQYQLDGLCVTWRHRARIWYALFKSGQSCLTLPACTSPLLTDPEACKARCALLCDRVAAYAAVRHRLETMKTIRQAYVERRAEELSRQRVLKLRDAPYRRSSIRLGDGASAGFHAGVTASSAFHAGASRMDGIGHVGQAHLYTPVCSLSEASPTSAWAELHGNNTKPPAAAITYLSKGCVERLEASEGQTLLKDSDVRRGRTGTPVPPFRHFDTPHGSLHSAYSRAADLQTEAPWCVSRRSPPPLHHIAANTTAEFPAEQGEAPVVSMRHATRLFPSAKCDDDPYGPGCPRPSQSLAPAASTMNWDVANAGAHTATRSAPAGEAATTAPPAASLFCTSSSCSVAPYASSTTLAPSRTASAQQPQLQHESNATATMGTTSASRLALSAAAASAQMDLILHVERDDTLAKALNHLADFRAASITPPLVTVLSVVPRTAQLVRGAGAGVTEEQAPAVLPTCEGSAASTPLYAGFVPSPVELQQRLTQPFNISIAQVQQLIQWQWEHHQHLYTPLPLPLCRRSVVPSVNFSLFASSGRRRDDFDARRASSPFSAPPSYAVSPLARELLVHLVRWSWLLPAGCGRSTRSFQKRNRRCGGASRHHAPWMHLDAFFSRAARERGARGHSWSLRHWRVLCLLAVCVLIAQYPARCFSFALSITVVYCSYNGLAVGLTTRLPSHRGGSNSQKEHTRDSASLHEWRPRLFLLCGPRIRLPRLCGFTGSDPYRRNRRHHRGSPPFPLSLGGDMPPLQDRVSLLYNLSEATSLSLQEHRREHFIAQAVATRVLRYQTCAAALMSRLHLAFYGYSTALSFWLALLSLSYLLLYVVYGCMLRKLGVGSVSVYGGAATGSGSLASQSGSALRLFADATGAFLRQFWAANVSLPASGPVGQASVDFLRHMTEAAWREAVEPLRFLLLQRMQAAADAEGDADVTPSSLGAGEASWSATKLEDSADSGQGRRSYFYQSGRYYAYDAEPPAWARSRMSPEVAPMKETASSGAQFSMQDSSTGATSSPPSASQMVRSLSDWVVHTLRGDRTEAIATADTQRDHPHPGDSRAGVKAAERMYGTGATEPLRANASISRNATPDGYFISTTESAEVSLLWFFVFAYFITFCLPRSPFRWLWRRVWGVLTHDDALARCPLLSV
ncbi:hypothetical protein ABL78_1719 [Leptomonas seymouri]|uniref:Uncharacterized protein n=1 Tax=Leptomonas seymouri TaxID=5684 RepID=A0A0N0P7T9_LEPSE|nr:hypothetical protein ABL78_1719 [Leptomonas seymouri]|eukprot:KPI89156.1 hypothetical protein ABL78_1719 [Leptomonas seymouri]